jgi:hypothetical protein
MISRSSHFNKVIFDIGKIRKEFTENGNIDEVFCFFILLAHIHMAPKFAEFLFESDDTKFV